MQCEHNLSSFQTSQFSQVDHPLCLECTAKVREEVAAILAEVEAECAAYQAGLDQLEKEASKQPSSEVGEISRFQQDK